MNSSVGTIQIVVGVAAAMRPTPRRVLKSLCIVTVMGFLVMNLNLLVQTADEELRRNSITDIQLLEEQADGAMVKNPNASHSRGSNQSQGNANGQSNYNVVEREMPERTNYSRDGSKRKDAPRNKIVSLNERIKKEGLVPVLESGPLNSPPELNATFIRNFIVNTNKAQLIHNLDKFDLRAGSETLVIVVQVHNRADYLRHLVDSLRKAKNIEHSLLIFSHDYYAEEMNEIVRAIDFCPVSSHCVSFSPSLLFFAQKVVNLFLFLLHVLSSSHRMALTSAIKP